MKNTIVLLLLCVIACDGSNNRKPTVEKKETAAVAPKKDSVVPKAPAVAKKKAPLLTTPDDSTLIAFEKLQSFCKRHKKDSTTYGYEYCDSAIVDTSGPRDIFVRPIDTLGLAYYVRYSSPDTGEMTEVYAWKTDSLSKEVWIRPANTQIGNIVGDENDMLKVKMRQSKKEKERLKKKLRILTNVFFPDSARTS